MLRAANSKKAWEIEEKYKGQPHGWIQWKGTDVCMDIYCQCGKHLHFDGDFLYEVQCPYCGQAYSVNGHVQLIPIDHPTAQVKIPEKDDDSNQ